MKKLITAVCIALSTTSFGQGSTFTQPITFTNASLKATSLPDYSSGSYKKIVLNSTTKKWELTSNTALSGKVTATTEKDSARSYTHTGSYITYIKWAGRDTVSMPVTAYSSNQIFTFASIDNNADTTVFVPTSGTIDNAAYYSMTGTRNSVSFWFDGTNFWIIK